MSSVRHVDPFIYVNGRRYILDRVDPYQSLGSFLNQLNLMGARKVDDENMSGADAVTLARYCPDLNRVKYVAVSAYSIPLVAVVGQEVITVEGIGSVESMNPIQRRFYSCESFQCGYCAGGFIMGMYSLLRENQKPTCADIEDALSGHFCRCTGYRPISAAAFGYAVDAPKEIFNGDPNWKFDESQKFDITKEPVAPKQIIDGHLNNYKFKRFVDDATKGIMMKGIEVPGSYDALKNILEIIPNTIIISPGNEDLMTNDKFVKDRSNNHYTLTHRVNELYKINIMDLNNDNDKEDNGDDVLNYSYRISVGLNASIQSFIDSLRRLDSQLVMELIKILEQIPKEHRNFKSFNSLLKDPCYSTVLSMFNPVKEEEENELSSTIYLVPDNKVLFSGIRSIKEALGHGFAISIVNVLSKNIKTCMCLVVKCPNVEVKRETLEIRYVDADNDKLSVDKLLDSVCSMSTDNEIKKYLGFLKHSMVKAIVASKDFDTDKSLETLANWTPENNNPPVTTRSFPMLEDTIKDEENKDSEGWNKYVGKIPPPDHKLHTKYVHKEILQQNGAEKVTGAIRYPIDKSHLYSEILHAFPVLTTVPCGSIVDIDLTEAQKVPGYFKFYSAKDLPENSPNLFSGILPNDTPVFVNKNGRVLHCDQMIGIVVATSRDVAVHCSKLVKVIYDTDMDSERNRNYKHRVDIERKRLDKAGDDNTSVENCFTIKQAMECNSYHPHCGVGERVITLGLNPINSEENLTNKDVVRDPDFEEHEPDRCTDAPMDPELSKSVITKIIDECDVKVEGEITIGGQEHFYGEPFTATVVPTSNDTYLVHVSSQNVSKIQADIARNMCIPSSKIIAEAENIGGGFGGKQDRPQIVAVPCAVASVLSKRPVTMTLSRDVDMRMSGGRHGYVFQYRAGFNREGKYEALDALLVADGGGSYDVTAAVLDKSIFQNTSVYTIPKVRIEGRAARTNHPTNTAYRGFGAPQTTQLCECIFDHAAQVLSIDPTELRRINLNKPGDSLITGTYTGSTKGCDIPQRLFKNIERMSDYENRKKFVEEFNKDPKNKYVKRGLAIVPLKNSVCFEEDFMNQSHALVHVYADGTVRVVHSGIEMGQGLNTKMRMVAAETLRVNIERVFVGPTGTNTCANTQPTAASSGTDVNAPAVRQACENIRKRLEKVRDSMGSKNESINSDGTPNSHAPIESYWGKAGFNGVVNSAYFGRVNLSDHVYFSLPHLQWSWPNKIGYTGFYTAYGVSCAEVEVNSLTGEFKTIRCDVIEDVGNTLNPALDCGQVEGGFTQGFGWITTEELCYDSESPNATGTLLNSSLSEYKVPTMKTVPSIMNVSLIDGTGDPMSAYGAKASAEAPVCLCSGVHFAIRDAVRACRKEMGKEGLVCIPAPTTPLTVSAFL